MKHEIRLELATDKKLKINYLIFDSIYGNNDVFVVPGICDYTQSEDRIILKGFKCYNAKLMASISTNELEFNDNIKLIVYPTDINDNQVYFDNVVYISITLHAGNVCRGSQQIDINNIYKRGDGNIEDEEHDDPPVEELKSMIINYKEEVEKLKLEVESLKDIVNAGRTSTDELCEKLDRAIANYKSSTRVYK